MKFTIIFFSWILLCTGVLSLLTGAPEPFLAAVFVMVTMGVPLCFIFAHDNSERKKLGL